MYIKQITLENIRSYSEQTIFFPKGTILLSGDIGSGKSTILQAIEFAFFGIIRGELSGNSLLRYDSKKGAVKLTFVLDEQEFTITRGLQRTKTTVAQTTGSLDVGGIVEELSAQELTNRIFTLLAYPSHYSHKSQSLLYRYTVYTSQEKMKEILFEQVETRLQTLRALFGVEKYKTISANSQLVLKELRLKKAFLDGQTANIGELEQQQVELNEQHIDLESKKKEHTAQLTQLQKKEDSAKELLNKAQLAYEQMLVLEQNAKKNGELRIELTQSVKIIEGKIAELTQKETTLRESIAKLGDVASKVDVTPLLDEKEAYQKTLFAQKEARLKQKSELDLIVSQIKTYTKQLTDLAESQTQLTESKNQLTKFETHLKAFADDEKSIESYTTAIESLSEKQGAIRARLKQYDESLDNLNHDGTCPTCLQSIDAKHKSHTSEEITLKKESDKNMLAISERTKQSLLEKITSCKKSVLAKNSAMQKMQTVVAEIKRIEEGLIGEKELIAKLRDLTERKTLLEKPIEKVADEVVQKLDALVLKIQTVQKQNALAEQKEKVLVELSHVVQNTADAKANEATYVAKLTRVVKDIESDTFSIEKMQQTRTALHDAKETLLSAQQAVFEVTKTLSQLEISRESVTSQLEKCKVQMTQMQTQRKLGGNISHYHTWVKKSFIPLMGTLERAVFTSAYQECQTAFSRWFNLLLPDESLHAQLDANFTPQITQDGYETSLEHLSGGEKTSIALVYRLALNHVINQVVSTIKTRDLLILDEPTDGFSFEQLDRVKDVLDQLKLEQLIIVSHEQKVESFVDSIIRVTKTNHVSVVEQL